MKYESAFDLDDDGTISCPHDPKTTTGPIGMYHCPECGVMVMAGQDHWTDKEVTEVFGL